MRRFALLVAVLLLPSAAHAKWYEASSTHFVVYAEDSTRDVRKFTEQLEYYHDALGVITGMQLPPPSPSNRVTVYIVSSLNEVRKIYGALNSSVGGFYIPRPGGSLAVVPKLSGSASRNDYSQTILLHEYTHHFLLSNGSFPVPRWFGEGSAEFFAAARFEENGGLSIGLPAAERYSGLQTWGGVRAEHMLDPAVGDARLRNAYDMHRFYAKSWLLYHYLNLGGERPGQLAQYLKLMVSGKSSRDAALEAFGDFTALDRDIESYARKPRLLSMKFEPGQLEAGKISLRELPDGEAEMLSVQVRSRRGVASKEAAEALAAEARGIAARFPDDPAVQATLAEAEFDAGNDEAAIAAADRAIALDPGQVNAYLQKGYAMFRMADEEFFPEAKEEKVGEEDDGQAASTEEAPRVIDPDRTDDARKAYNRALAPFLELNAIENDHPIPLLYLYRSYAARGARPTETAIQALERAAELAPFDFGLKLTLATQRIRDKDYDKARLPLEAIAYNPHGGPLAEAATRMIEAMAEEDPPEPDELLDMLRAEPDGAAEEGGEEGAE